jgi:hypothetical protein
VRTRAPAAVTENNVSAAVCSPIADSRFSHLTSLRRQFSVVLRSTDAPGRQITGVGFLDETLARGPTRRLDWYGQCGLAPGPGLAVQERATSGRPDPRPRPDRQGRRAPNGESRGPISGSRGAHGRPPSGEFAPAARPRHQFDAGCTRRSSRTRRTRRASKATALVWQICAALQEPRDPSRSSSAGLEQSTVCNHATAVNGASPRQLQPDTSTRRPRRGAVAERAGGRGPASNPQPAKWKRLAPDPPSGRPENRCRRVDPPVHQLLTPARSASAHQVTTGVTRSRLPGRVKCGKQRRVQRVEAQPSRLLGHQPRWRCDRLTARIGAR